ncbi:IS1/IS1595 family N-terminal zinc-binding domain-containing protein [Caloramator sp. mosi_1]
MISQNLYRFGKDKAGNQKYQCKDCRRSLYLKIVQVRRIVF